MRPTILPLVATAALLALPVAAETPQQAYRRGFQDGVAAVNAQMGQVTARIQQQVQDQVNAQLAQIEAQRGRELDARLAAAQAEALTGTSGPATTATGTAAPGLPVSRMPTLPPIPQPSRAAAGQAAPLPSDPAALQPGTTITITDPQALPPELFRMLMEHVRR
ncbi:hypothetical protein [Paracoccus endophyticus]|uniref:hypothetical protein n=1 Tax=Paracoccus endophyticus TaxID=2233774 RepID=UPI000DD55D4C|nr:hypothetical protein [Paracoccus endophyticus]